MKVGRRLHFCGLAIPWGDSALDLMAFDRWEIKL